MQKSKERRFFKLISIIVLIMATVAISWGTFALAENVVQELIVGTTQPGSLHNSVAQVFARFGATTDLRLVVRPHSGQTVYLQILDKDDGEIEFATCGAADCLLAYAGSRRTVEGKNPYPPQGMSNLRLVMQLFPLRSGLLVRSDSGMAEARDLRGKRVSAVFPAAPALHYNLFASLANVELTWKDVRIVPTTDTVDSVRKLMDGQVDVAVAAIDAGITREAQAKVGVQFLNLDCSSAGRDRLRAAVPGIDIEVVKAGKGILTKDTCLYFTTLFFVTHKNISDKTLTDVMTRLWDESENFKNYYPGFKEWGREKTVSRQATIPYHAAAVEFYKTKGLWSAEMDKLQKELVDLVK